jgi:hypothetical protein
MSNSELSAAGISVELRRLVHDIKNQLYVVNMGLEVMRGSRENPDEVLRLINSIRTDGLDPLKSSVAALLDKIAPQQGSSGDDA